MATSHVQQIKEIKGKIDKIRDFSAKLTEKDQTLKEYMALNNKFTENVNEYIKTISAGLSELNKDENYPNLDSINSALKNLETITNAMKETNNKINSNLGQIQN